MLPSHFLYRKGVVHEENRSYVCMTCANEQPNKQIIKYLISISVQKTETLLCTYFNALIHFIPSLHAVHRSVAIILFINTVTHVLRHLISLHVNTRAILPSSPLSWLHSPKSPCPRSPSLHLHIQASPLPTHCLTTTRLLLDSTPKYT